MIQVKEFQDKKSWLEPNINKWITKYEDAIEIIDIKYSIGIYRDPDAYGVEHESKIASGALVVYKIINIDKYRDILQNEIDSM